MSQTKVKLVSNGVITVDNLNASHGITTDHIGEGSNQYYTDARVSNYLTTNSYATEGYVGTVIQNLVSSAPETLDTLNELAAALGDDPNFATTVTNSIATKVDTTTFNTTTTSLTNSINTKLDASTWTASAASGITSTQVTNWNTAYGWGNHAGAGYHINSYNNDMTANQAFADNWFRSTGSTGWYSQTYGGGIYMTDTTWVRVYNNKQFYVSSTSNEAIATAGDVVALYSDMRLKTKVGNIENALDKVSKLNGFYYIENDKAKELGYNNDQVQIGVSAQEVKEVLPEVIKRAPVDMLTLEDGTVVSKTGKDYMTVKYERIVPLLIEAIKELKQEINELKK